MPQDRVNPFVWKETEDAKIKVLKSIDKSLKVIARVLQASGMGENHKLR